MLSGSLWLQSFRTRKAFKLPLILNKSLKTVKSAYQYFKNEAEVNRNASEWLQDNYYIVEKAIRQIRKDLPFKYYSQLPVSISSSSKDLTRIFSICSEILEDQSEKLNISTAIRFLKKYQRKQSLTTGEIWAIPSMLRLCILLELTESLESILNDGGSDIDISLHIQNLRLLDDFDWKKFFERELPKTKSLAK